MARCTVERLMGELGLEGVIRGQRRRTTVPEPSVPRPPDLVDRDFTASRPDQLWVADMTYVRTWSRWAYVAFVLDVSRTYIQTLMSRTASDQAWGVSTASGAEYALKNGWLQRATSGLWDVNSVGRVTVDGHRYLVTVLSDGSASMSDGISLVERAARQAVTAAART